MVLDAIKIGKDDIGLMKILLTNYMEMNNHKKVPFPNDKKFRQMIHSVETFIESLFESIEIDHL